MFSYWITFWKDNDNSDTSFVPNPHMKVEEQGNETSKTMRILCFEAFSQTDGRLYLSQMLLFLSLLVLHMEEEFSSVRALKQDM